MADENNPNDGNTDVDEETNTVTYHVGTDADESGRGGDGVDVMDMAGGDDVVGSSGGSHNILLGGSGDDILVSTGTNDVVLGGSGADMIYARGGDSIIRGGTGNDTIYGGNAADKLDILLGDEGDDQVKGDKGTDIIYGGEGDDILDGGEGVDLVVGGAGDDEIEGGGGNDYIIGGEGDDTLTGDAGADLFIFSDGDGDDTITDFDTANDVIDLTSFDSSISWDDLSAKFSAITDPDDPNTVTGVEIDLSDFGGGTITLEGVTSTGDLTSDMFNLPIIGDENADTLTGGAGDDWIDGGAGDDTLTGGSGADTFTFDAGDGDDTITDFDTENDLIVLNNFDTAITWDDLSAKFSTITDPDDPNTVTGVKIDLSDFGGGSITLDGVTSTSDLTIDMFDLPDGAAEGDGDNAASEYIVGHSGDDEIDGGGGHDTLFGDEGDDTLYGGAGSDWLFGGEGGDTLYGGAGSDALIGGEGDDTLDGGADDDTLTGGTGNDTLTGGAGNDGFYYFPGHGNDTITDFTDGEDVINLTLFKDITQFSDLSVSQDGADVVIDLSGQGGGTLTLENFALSDLDAADFTFYVAPTEGDADGM